jgi:D-arabinose 1-dehydrogenase-like Zn-dependent alcohol dehydrogenase
MTQVADGLGIDGQLLIVGAAEKPIQFNSTQAISFRSGLRAWYSGTSMDSQETMAFSALSGVRPMVQTFPLEKYQEAYDAMMNSTVRFRAVITTGL